MQPSGMSSIAARVDFGDAHEAGVAGTVDPLGGSYAVEALTDQVERDALALIAEVDRLGGMVSAVAAGFPQRARYARTESKHTSTRRRKWFRVRRRTNLISPAWG